MVDYKPWNLKQFGAAYLANAKGTDIGKASAGSDEVEHMFGVFSEAYEKPAVESAESMGLEEWKVCVQGVCSALSGKTGGEDSNNYGRAYANQARQEDGCELTPNQARALLRTIETRVQTEHMRIF